MIFIMPMTKIMISRFFNPLLREECTNVPEEEETCKEVTITR